MAYSFSMIESKENIDCRMEWVLTLEECEKNKDKEREYYTEYEVCSEVRIGGVLSYGNGALLCAPFEEMDQSGLYTYIVRIKHIRKEYNFDENNYSKNGYYFEDGLIGELLSVFSVYFQARFYLKATITGLISPEDVRSRSRKQFLYKRPFPLINFEMFSDHGRNWAHADGLELFLDKIRTLDQQYHQCLIRACFWYSEAIKDIGIDHQMFFIKMVSATEALLGSSGILSDSLEKKLTNLINGGQFTAQEAEEVKNWIKDRKISHKFSIFLAKYSNGFFKGGKRNAPHCFIKKEDRNKYVKRIYNARSKYLHDGRPMYMSHDMTLEEAKLWDLDPTRGKNIDRNSIPANNKLPRVRWFERITNYCLKSFIEEKTAVIKSRKGVR